MKLTVWHVMIGLLLIGYFIGAAALVAYALYGPEFEIKVPDFFGLGSATTTEVSLEGEPVVPAPVPLAGYPGTLFECEGDKALKADFSDGLVRLALSDSRQLSLPQTISRSGARYANTDESFVFWNNGGTAFIEESGAMTYAGCSTTVTN